MSKPAHLHPADIHGIARLAADATASVTEIVEAMHAGIASPLAPERARSGRAGGVAGLAYWSVRGAVRLVGGTIDLAAAPLVPLAGPRMTTPERDALLSVLSGVIGDHLAATRNPLAVPMELRRGGRALVLNHRRIAEALPRVSSRAVVMIHGLCGTDAQWKRTSTCYATTLERDFGFTPVYLRYNSGLHVSTNGRALSQLLDELASAWPVPLEELMFVGHSMGGLVARSAMHHAELLEHDWVMRVRRVAFLGTPHHGAPLERGGNWFEELAGQIPFAGPLSRLGRLRSAGVTDLRYGNLLDEDWNGEDRFARSGDRRRPVPLPAHVDCLAIAATTGARRGDVRDRLVGDGLVPIASALGHHADPSHELDIRESRRAVICRTHHMGLLGHPEVEQKICDWMSGDLPSGRRAIRGRVLEY